MMKTKKTKKAKEEKSSISKFLKSKKGKTGLMSGFAGLGIIIAGQLASSSGFSMVGDLGMIAGIMAAVIPMAMLQMKESRRRDNIDRNMPFFLLSLSGSVKSGQNLIRAIEESADRNMGSLTPELKNLRANLSWGMPVDEAFKNFVERVGTRMAQRVIVLLGLAMHIGGNVANIIDVIQKHVTEMANLEKERKSALQPYIFTIYISFAVFLGITIILVTQFFVEIENVQESLQATVEPGASTSIGSFGAILSISVPELQTVIFHMTIVEAIFGGLAAGKIGESSIIAGIKHVVILVVISVVAFMAVGVGL